VDGAEGPSPADPHASVRFLLVASLLPPLSLAALHAARTAGAWPVAADVAAYALLSMAALGVARRLRLGLGLFLSLATLNLALLTPELFLRLVGFRREAGIQFGYPRPEAFLRLRPDPQLFWTLPPGPGVNALGFAGPEVVVPKPRGVFRIVFLSDSVGFQGYPAKVAARLQARLPEPRRFESVSLCLTGYSSHQGRVLAETWGPRLQADAAVVGYGWNDHWQAWGAPDDRKRIPIPASPVARLATALEPRLRVVQAATYLLRGARGEERPLTEVRVSLDRYRENLGRIADIFESRGARVMLLTAATSHDRLPVPRYLVRDGFAPDAASVLSRHRLYNDAVRALGRSRELRVVDLDEDLREAGPPRRLFLEDGIHLTPAGLDAVASRVADALLESIVAPPARPARSRN